MRTAALLVSLGLLAILLGGCSRNGQGPPQVTPSVLSGPQKVEAAGLKNVYRLNDRIYSGSSPEGDEGFASLQKLGIKTIISVDGSEPEVERAHKFGLRYVHLPIGYEGVPAEQGLRIAKAVRDLPGPVYIHCHHGKHRGPAAAAVARLCTDEKCTLEAALEGMRQAGTDPHYTGLYAAPRELHRPTAAELDRVPANFPELTPPVGLAERMVEIDDRWDHLKQAREAGWKSPADHPDIDPPHEALQLVEQFREAMRLPETKDRPEEFRTWLREAQQAGEGLESALRRPAEPDAIEAAYKTAGAACTRCHAIYRDVRKR